MILLKSYFASKWKTYFKVILPRISSFEGKLTLAHKLEFPHKKTLLQLSPYPTHALHTIREYPLTKPPPIFPKLKMSTIVQRLSSLRPRGFPTRAASASGSQQQWKCQFTRKGWNASIPGRACDIANLDWRSEGAVPNATLVARLVEQVNLGATYLRHILSDAFDTYSGTCSTAFLYHPCILLRWFSRILS